MPEMDEMDEMDMMGSGTMHGGVVRTKEGYDFYRGQLDDRINQLNAMNSLAQGYAVPMGQKVNTLDNQTTGPPNKVEFFAMLRFLADSVEIGDLNRFSFDNLKDLLGRLFQFGPVAGTEDFEDIVHALDLIVGSLRNFSTNSGGELNSRFAAPEQILTMQIMVDKARTYAREMFSKMNLSERDRLTLSKSLVKSLGFDRYLRDQLPTNVIGDAASTNSRVAQSYMDFDDADSAGGGDGRFEFPAPAREDEEQEGVERAPFAGNNGDPNREAWGERRGAYDRPAAYFGEEPLANPLSYSGPDTTTETAPPQNVAQIVQATSDAIDRVLDAFGGSAGTRESVVAAQYPDPRNFVDEVAAALEEQSYSPAQIAAGMEGQPDLQAVFAEYIGENAGDLAPAPIAGRTYAPQTGTYAVPVGYTNGLPAGSYDGWSTGSSSIGAPPPRASPPLGSAPAPRGRSLADLRREAEARRTAAAAPTSSSSGAAGRPAFKYPATRAELRNQIRTIDQARAFGATIPKEYGGPYNPRASSKLSNVISTIIRAIREHNPNY
jgi:hypothetical protein